MLNQSIGFIGGGRVTRLMLTGFKRADRLPRQIVVSDTNAEVLARLQAAFPEITITGTDNRAPAAQQIVFLALHPPAMGPVLEDIRPVLKSDAVVISLAPKLSLEKLSAGLNGFDRLARMIPNAPSIVNAGYNPMAWSAGLTGDEKTALCDWLGTLGTCPEVAEEKLETYAIITAMGPTYFWFQWEELSHLGLTFGLDPEEIETGLSAMITGAMATRRQAGLSPAEVMDLIPVKPLGEDEETIRAIYQSRLEAVYRRLKG